jgi:excisionase family DNA binding protein
MDRLINFQEAADMLGISKRTLLRMIHRGDFRVVQLSARVPRIRLCDLEAYVDANTVTYSAPAIV